MQPKPQVFAALLLAALPASGAIMVTDGTFDTGAGTEAAGTDIVGWFDTNTSAGATDWWTNTSYVNGISPTPTIGVILGDGTGGVGGPGRTGGRFLYQDIGTKEDGIGYTISLDYGQPTDGNADRAVGIRIEIYQGTFAGAADDVDIATGGLTLIQTLNTPMTSLVGEGNFASYSSPLDLSTANTSDPLWLKLSNVPGTGTQDGSWAVIDNVAIVPEPGAAVLGMLGALGLLRRRRGA